MRSTLLATGFALVFGASLAEGAEYFIYRDPAGTIVLSISVRPPQQRCWSIMSCKM
jgi:hypothetical protein